MFNKDKDTITYTYNMSFICSSNFVTPLLISTCSVLRARQNSNIYTLVLHRVTTEFVIRPTRGMNIHIYNYLKHNIYV
jgi:hypothetical protein